MSITFQLIFKKQHFNLLKDKLFVFAVGPKRKYYLITDAGKDYLKQFEREYCALEKIIKNILEEDDE